MSKPTTDARGRRYGPAEKKQVLDYIAQVNREKRGRGGQVAAHRKFGIALVTLKLWAQNGPGIEDHASASNQATAHTLLQLQSLAKKITTLEKKIASLRYDYEKMEQKP